jgi:hypothetical protein
MSCAIELHHILTVVDGHQSVLDERHFIQPKIVCSLWQLGILSDPLFLLARSERFELPTLRFEV